jgi:hypothetical protein
MEAMFVRRQGLALMRIDNVLSCLLRDSLSALQPIDKLRARRHMVWAESD